MLCDQCGHPNPAGSRFCSKCGSALANGGVDDATTSLAAVVDDTHDERLDVPVDVDPAGPAVLVVKRGPNAGTKLVLEGERVRAGRSPDNELFLDDITVSRHHAEFIPVAGGYQLRDTSSLNGTYLNRERIDAAPLANGDEVQIGKFKLVFLTGGRYTI